jgi:signal transduction histidine kinase
MDRASPPLAAAAKTLPKTGVGGFRLVRYFTVAALSTFLLVGLSLYVLEHGEIAFFEKVQKGQSAFFRQSQTELSRKTDQAAKKSLVAAQEAANENMTDLLANVLWESDFGPFIARVQSLSVDYCRTIEEHKKIPATMAPEARKECFAELGRKIRALPGFDALDKRTFSAMKGSTVFKIKVYDLRGLTVYSSEHKQIGEDKAANAGWRSAAAGKAASELTHRDQFSAFEGVVENRDLLSSYIPVRRKGSDEVLGVFEIYADVTPFLGQVKGSSAELAAIVANNQEKIEQAARQDAEIVAANSGELLRVVGALLVGLFVALLLIVKRGQNLIDAQILAQKKTLARERLWHHEKMAAMAAMAANVSHETGNALTIISGLARELSDPQPGGIDPQEATRLIADQTNRIVRMSRQITTFALAGGNDPQLTDVNRLIEAVCYFFNFDLRFRSKPIEFRAGEGVPTCRLVSDHLKEVMMNLLPSRRGRVTVETAPCEQGVTIRITTESTANVNVPEQAVALADAQLELARRRLADMGGTLKLSGADAGLIEIILPTELPQGATQ